MMIKPPDEQIEKHLKLLKYLRYENDTDYIYLDKDAPEEIKTIYSVV